MPEGDTIYKVARTLRAALVGAPVLAVGTKVARIRALGPQRLVRRTVEDVEPRGKHLLIWFGPRPGEDTPLLALHSHLRMTGSWHLYRPGERWRKPAHLARFTLEVPGAHAVCFSAPVLELLTAAQVATHPALAALGPDVLDEEVDLAEARRRLDAQRDASIADALLDQRVLAGVGNVFKCEILHRHGVDPWTPVEELDGETRDALLATAERLLKRNVAPGAVRRTTTADGTLAVYGRARRPCPVCGTAIRVARHGVHARLTYWCPTCQGPGAERSGRRPG